MKTKHTILSFFLLAGYIHAADPEPTDKKPATFFVHAGHIKHTYSCAVGVEAGYIEDGVIHANLRRGNDRYLLIAHSELSRPNHPNGRCGCGIESYLVWLHIRGTTVIASQSAQYESCWKDISGGTPTWSGQFCTVEYENFDFNYDTNESINTRSKASFDAKTPEKGMQVSSQPPEKRK